jgi:hypothetical protein
MIRPCEDTTIQKSVNTQETPHPMRGTRLLRDALVVVASILVAFALDAWWSQRAEERTETMHLRALRSDFEQNVARLEELIQSEVRIADASRRLLRVATSPTARSPEDSVRNLLGQVFNSARFAPVMGAYEAVVSSGGLAQLRDDSLRLALADFASLLEGRYPERFSDEVYFDFVRSYTGQLGFTDAVIASDSNDAERATVLGESRSQLLRDPKFREHLALRYLAERDVAGAYRGLLEKANGVLGLTRRALGDRRTYINDHD